MGRNVRMSRVERGTNVECHKRSLLRRYCNKCPSGSPEEVAKQIPQVLEERMGYKRQETAAVGAEI